MKRFIAMPSPNGTNHEQLYIPRRAAAYDAKPRPEDCNDASVRAGYRAANRVMRDEMGNQKRMKREEDDDAAPLSASMQPETRTRVADAIKKYRSKSIVKDEDPMDNDDQHWIEQVLQFCEGKLDDEDMKELAEMLHSALDPDAVMDEPPPFKGQPLTGGKIREAQDRKRRRVAQDAAADFVRNFPEVARIKRAW